MRSRPSHELNKVVVPLEGKSICAEVTDLFREDLSGSVKAERNLDVFVHEISVDGFRAADNSGIKAI